MANENPEEMEDAIAGDLTGEVRVETDKTVDGEVFRRIYTTQHQGGFVSKTAVHADAFDHRIGGARFVDAKTTTQAGQETEVCHLSVAMTHKNAAAGLPADGQKSVIVCERGVPSEAARVRILTAHLRAVAQRDPGIIVGPDMANGESVLNVISRDPGDRAHITGLSQPFGGLGIDTNGYTAFGLGVALRTARAALGAALDAAVVQGSGAVGQHMLAELSAADIPVRAINNKLGTLVARNEAGLGVASLRAALLAHGDDGLAAYAEGERANATFLPRPDALFEVSADIFVPAARTSVLALAAELETARAENPDARAVEAWQDATRPKLIVQGANHPITVAGEAFLHGRGVVNLPDYIVNCGGLIGCLIEWAWREELLAEPAAHARIDRLARGFIARVVQTNVTALLAEGTPPREAALALAAAARTRNLAAYARQPGADTKARVRAYLESVVGG